jgi:diguanylate cyclase (GGDEF)-like protein
MNEKGNIAVTTKSTDTEILLRVADSGPGIPESVRARLFEPNFSTKTDGMGIGLAMVKKTVDELGGSVVVESETGKGSRFSFYLRVREGEKRDLHFRYFFDREFLKANKNQCNLSLILVAIKNFPELTDIFGEEKANLLLEALQKVLKDSLFRQADVLIHYKRGEIFVVICEAEKNGAAIIRKRIKNRLREFSGDSLGAVLKKSIIGVGVATYPEEANSQRELFRKALKNIEEDSNGQEKDSDRG